MRAMVANSRQRKVQHDEPTSRGGSGCAHDDCAVQPAHFTIPLKPQDKPASFPTNFAHAVKEEYAIKYLEKLGAHPTTENIAMVLENLPLEECHIATAWKSRGSLSDVITIDLYPHARPDAHKQTELRQSGSLQGNSNNSEATRRAEQDDCLTSANNNQHERQATLSTLKPYHVGPVCLSFDDMKRQYLLPFKHGSKEEVDILSTYGMKHDEPVSFVNIPALATSGTAAVHLLGRRATQRRVKCMEERVIAPDAKPDIVMQMQKSFYRSLPLAALDVREEHEKLGLYEAVMDAKMAQLIQSLAKYLYYQVFVKLACAGAVDLIKQHASSLVPTASPGDIESLYVTVIRVFTKIKQQLAHDEENGIRLFLPLLLLELRVAVETVYRIQYPVSFNVTGSTMQYILMQMDDAITKLLDPDEHLSRIGVLETTCESTKIMASHPFQGKRRQLRLRDQFYKTSEALHSIFPRPHAGKCRKIIKLRGGASVANYPPHLEAPPQDNQVSSAATNTRDSEELTMRRREQDELESARSAATQQQESGHKSVSVDGRLQLLRIIERKGRRKR